MKHLLNSVDRFGLKVNLSVNYLLPALVDFPFHGFPRITISLKIRCLTGRNFRVLDALHLLLKILMFASKFLKILIS